MGKLTTVTVAARSHHVEVDTIGTAEAEELFGADKVSEVWGVIRVSLPVSKVRSALRDAGYRTKVAQ